MLKNVSNICQLVIVAVFSAEIFEEALCILYVDSNDCTGSADEFS